MNKDHTSSLSIKLSIRLYEALLIFFPSDFRKAYREPMLQVFRDCCRKALGEDGSKGLLVLWGRTMLDTVQTAIEEHSQRGVEMSKEKFIKISGWALMLGDLALIFGLLSITRPAYDPYNAQSLFFDQYANAAKYPLIVIGFLLVSLGFTGLDQRYGQRAGLLARFWLILGVISGISGAAGTIEMSVYDQAPWWSIFMLSIIALFLSLTLFGIESLRQRALPHWNILPVITGIWLPVLTLYSLFSEQISGQFAQPPSVAVLVTLVLTLVGLFGLGYMLQKEVQSGGRAISTT